MKPSDGHKCIYIKTQYVDPCPDFVSTTKNSESESLASSSSLEPLSLSSEGKTLMQLQPYILWLARRVDEFQEAITWEIFFNLQLISSVSLSQRLHTMKMGWSEIGIYRWVSSIFENWLWSSIRSLGGGVSLLGTYIFESWNGLVSIWEKFEVLKLGSSIRDIWGR